jgi:DNA-binding MarR family transcriptional regulator
MDVAQDQNSPYVEAYSRFLNLQAAVEMMLGMEQFGINEKALFEEVLLAWSKQAPLTVREIINIERLGSPATLHKRLTRLRAMDLVDATYRGNDRRTKYLSPTNKGLEFAKNLGEACTLVFQKI